MDVHETFKSGTQIGRVIFSTALAAAITALLVVAVPASAELTEGVAAAPIAAAEVPVPVSPAPAEGLPPVGQTEAPDTASAFESAVVEPVATEDVTSAVGAAATTIEDDVVGAAQGNLSGSTKAIDTAMPSPRTVTDSISEAADEAGALTKTAAVASGSQQQVSRLAESLREDSAKTIEGIRQDVARTTASITGRLPALPAISALPELPELLDSIGPAKIASSLPSSEPIAAAAEEVETGAAPSLLERPRPDLLLLRLNTIDLEASIGESLAGPAGVGTVGFAASDRSDRNNWALSSSRAPADATFAGTTVNRVEGPTPVDIPLPAPGSPATTTSGSGSSSFVPLAALLALLALVAPAALRRLWEAPDFRAPTPFVCALERPG